jgi:hypothetical protein
MGSDTNNRTTILSQIWLQGKKKTSQTDLVGGLNHLEKYQSVGMIIPNI